MRSVPVDSAVMRPGVSKWALVLLCPIGLFESAGIYFGGWASGNTSHHGISTTNIFCVVFGSTYFWADAGDTLELNYDAEIREGMLQLWISRMTPGVLGDVEGRKDITVSDSGTWRARITRRGLYHLVIWGSSANRGSGYDFKYRLSWRFDRGKGLFSRHRKSVPQLEARR